MRTATVTSPFNCRWIAEGSACEIENVSLALCIRLAPQIVTARDCEHCEHWLESDRPVDRKDTAM